MGCWQQYSWGTAGKMAIQRTSSTVPGVGGSSIRSASQIPAAALLHPILRQQNERSESVAMPKNNAKVWGLIFLGTTSVPTECSVISPG